MDYQAFGLDKHRVNYIVQVLISHQELCPYAIKKIKAIMVNKGVDMTSIASECTCAIFDLKQGQIVQLKADVDYEQLPLPTYGRIIRVDRFTADNGELLGDVDLPYSVEYFIDDIEHNNWFSRGQLEADCYIPDDIKVFFLERTLEDE